MGNAALAIVGGVAQALQNPAGRDLVEQAQQELARARDERTQAQKDLATWHGWGATWAVYPAAPTDRERNMDDDGLRLAIAERIDTPVWVMQRTNLLDGEFIDGVRVESMKQQDGHTDWRVTWHGVTLALANNEFAAVATAKAHLNNFPADMLRRAKRG